MNKYAAKLLFEFQTVRGGRDRIRRVVEERIINFQATSDRDALRKAKSHGRSEEWRDEREGTKVSFRFVGVLDLRDMLAADDSECWYELKEMLRPLERRAQLIPSDEQLVTRAGLRTQRRNALKVY